MEIPGKIIGGLFKAVGLVPKRPKLPAPVPVPTRSDAAEQYYALEGENVVSQIRGRASSSQKVTVNGDYNPFGGR